MMNEEDKSKKMKSKYIPKQFLQMFNQEEMSGSRIIWNQVDGFNLSVSFCCYYYGGQWRHVTASVDLRDMVYRFASVFYQNGSEKEEGQEITKSDWKRMGHSIQNDGLSFSEVIPINDHNATEWFASKNIIQKISDPKYDSAGGKIALFLNTIRVYSKLAQNSETHQEKLNKIIENLGVMKNVKMVKDMLERQPNEKIWDEEGHNIQNLYSVSSIKNSRQINPEHIYQIEKPFFGKFNVDTQ